MGDRSKNVGLPYVPVHRPVIAENSTFFLESRIIEGYCAPLPDGRLDARPLIGLLQGIRDSNGNGGKGEAKSHDGRVAYLVLEAFKEKGYDVFADSPIPLSASDIYAAVGAELALQLKMMLHVREEEQFFQNELSTKDVYEDAFSGLRERFSKYGISPENVNSFMARLVTPKGFSIWTEDDYNLQNRFRSLIAIAAARGQLEGRFGDAVRFLSAYLVYEKGGNLYALSEDFAPVMNNPNMQCHDVDPPCGKNSSGRVNFYVSDADRLWCGAMHFLMADVEGEHYVSDAILHDWRTNAEFKLNLPPEIEIMEGESREWDDVFQTNVVGLEQHIEWNFDAPVGAEDRFIWGYDHQDRLTIKAHENLYNHEQYRIGIKATVRVHNLEYFVPIELADEDFDTVRRDGRFTGALIYNASPLDAPPDGGQQQFMADHPKASVSAGMTIVNENEPPIFVLKAPDAVEEGGLFCMTVEGIRDSEGDPTAPAWRQTGGDEIALVEHDGRRKVCGQAPITGGIERPYQFEVRVRDRPPVKSPAVRPAEVTKDAMIFHLPSVAVETGEILKLPPEAIKFLTDPRKKDTGAIPFATSSYLYILMRLPTDIENFGYRLTAPVAEVVNVKGENIAGATGYRSWRPFKKLPGNTFSYQTYSAIHTWTKPGDYWFNSVANVMLKNLKDPIWIDVPVQGKVTIADESAPIEVRIGRLTDAGDGIVRLNFSVTNAVHNGEPVLAMPDSLPVSVKVEGEHFQRGVKLTARVDAKKVSDDGVKAGYMLEVPLDEYLRPARRSKMTLDLTIVDRNGEKAYIEGVDYIESNSQGTLYGDLTFDVPDDFMPMPWIYGRLGISNKERFAQYLPSLKRARFAFTASIRNRSYSLWHHEEYNGMDGDKVIIPLRFSEWEVALARTYSNVGGEVHGTSRFDIPAAAGGGEVKWNISVGWNSQMLAHAGIPGYPSPEKDIVVTEKSKTKKEIGFMELEDFVDGFGPAAIGKATLTAVEEGVDAGQEFHVRVKVPTLQKKFVLNRIYPSEPYDISMIATITKRKDSRGVVYSLAPIKVEEAGDEVVLTYRAPDFLPAGEYGVWIHLKKSINASYTVHWKDHGTKFKNTYNVEVLDPRTFAMDGMTIRGKADADQIEGEGGIYK